MSAESARHKPPVADTSAMIKRKRLEAELAGIDSQIRAFGRIRDKLTAAGQDPLAYYRELDARRASLLTDLKSTAVVARVPGTLAGTPLSSVDSSLLTRPIAPPRWWPGSGVFGFGTTGYVQAGTFADDLHIVAEGQSPVSGEITDVPGAAPGGVLFDGNLSVAPGAIDASLYSPAINYYWLRTWQLIVPS